MLAFILPTYYNSLVIWNAVYGALLVKTTVMMKHNSFMP